MAHTFKKAVLFAVVTSLVPATAGIKQVVQKLDAKQREFCNVKSKKGLATLGATTVAHALAHGAISKSTVTDVKDAFGRPTWAGNKARGFAALSSLDPRGKFRLDPRKRDAVRAVDLGDVLVPAVEAQREIVPDPDNGIVGCPAVDARDAVVAGPTDVRKEVIARDRATIRGTVQGLTTAATNVVIALTVVNTLRDAYASYQAKKAAAAVVAAK